MNSRKNIVKFLDVVICSAMLFTVTVTLLVGCQHKAKATLSDATPEPAYLLHHERGTPLVLQPNDEPVLSIINPIPSM
jgi:hypothetical protein